VSFNPDGESRSDQYSGEFAIYKNENEEIRGLKIYDYWSGVTEKKGEYELGRKIGGLSDEFSGKHIKASTKLLTTFDLAQSAKQELKIMRNEVFARYGYQFKKGGAMNSYFSKQKWYRPQHNNVDKFLTWLEKESIKIIQQEEKQR
jgi:hypothetical protein